jgi:hypothetical protein
MKIDQLIVLCSAFFNILALSKPKFSQILTKIKMIENYNYFSFNILFNAVNIE